MTGILKAHGTAELAARFQAVDWAFSESVLVPPHDLHPYPARFIPEIPSAALDLVPNVPGIVLDPFCGAGTTLVEAIRAGRRAVGIDLNPIAALISRVKVQRWRPQDDHQIESYAVGLRWAAERGNDEVAKEARSHIPRVDHWFSPGAQILLAGATAYSRSIEDPVWRDRVDLAISASIVRLSRQESDTRYAAVDKPFETTRGARLLEAALMKTADQLRRFAPHHSGEMALVLTADALDVPLHVSPGSVAAAIFSPPYPNAYEYWLYHKYRMYWLGFDPLPVRAAELGARPHYSGSGRATIDTFAAQMTPVMTAIGDALVAGGICFVVVGDSIIKGELVDNSALFHRLAAAAGLVPVGAASRPIRAGRKSFNPSIARAKHEHVLLFQK